MLRYPAHLMRFSAVWKERRNYYVNLMRKILQNTYGRSLPILRHSPTRAVGVCSNRLSRFNKRDYLPFPPYQGPVRPPWLYRFARTYIHHLERTIEPRYFRGRSACWRLRKVKGEIHISMTSISSSMRHAQFSDLNTRIENIIC
jgi:hypothetical protein